MLKKLILLVVSILTILTFPTNVNAAYCGGGSFKSWMTKGALSKSSAQYKYLTNHTTARADGLLVTDDGYIAVAMGPYFGKLGDKYHVTFSNGQTTKVVHVDTKAHYKPGCERIASRDGSVIEVILSGKSSSAFTAAKKWGNAGKAYTEFAGTSTITSIVRADGKPFNSTSSTTTPTTPTPTPTPTPTTTKPAAPTTAAKPTIKEEKQQLMILYIPEDEHKKLLFLDTEFSGDQRSLVQAALLVMEAIEDAPRHFYLTASFNAYSNIPVSAGFEAYTNIKQGFLGNHGVTPLEMEKLLAEFIDQHDLNTCETLAIGHGLRQDLEILGRAKCNLLEVDKYDTFVMAKRLLERESQVGLSDLVMESGIFYGGVHDAYMDAFFLIPAFSHLKLLEENKKTAK